MQRGHIVVRRGFGIAAIAVCLWGAVACSGGTGRNVLADTETRARAVRQLIEEGQYVNALSSADALVRSLQIPANGGLSEAAARALDALVEARWRNGDVSPDTLLAAQRVVEWRRAQTGSARTADSLRTLGRVLLLAGRDEESRAAFQSSLDTLETSGGTGDVAAAESLDGLAAALIELARYDEAQRALEQAMQIKLAATGIARSAIARTLELQSLTSMRAGRYKEARAPLDEALEIRRLQPPHPESAMTFLRLGDLLWFEGRPPAARDAYQQCLSITEKLLRPNHPDIAYCTTRLGLMLVNLGDLSGALPRFERAAAIAETSLGSQHPRFAGYLNDLAEAHLDLKDFRKARALYERALGVRERVLGPEHQNVATIVYNLALVSSDLGDLAEARRQFDRAIRIWSDRLGADHPFVALAKGSLAQTLLKHGRENEALALQREVLAMRERSLGPNHRDTADTLGDLASTLLVLARTREAAQLSARAIAIWQRDNARDSPGFAAALALRAHVLAASGDVPGARDHYTRALAITERVFGGEHPNSADLQVRLASLSAHAGQNALALQQALSAEEAARRFLLQTLRYLPEREAVSYASRRPTGLNLALSLAATSGTGRVADVEPVFDAVVRNRALVFDEIAARRQGAVAAPEAGVAALRTAWISARQRLANLSVRAGQTASATQLSVLQETRREAERAERALAEQSAAFQAEQKKGAVTLADIKAGLPPRTALVSFVRYDRAVDATAATPGIGSVAPSYLAFVVGPTSPHATVTPLGPASLIEPEIAEWRRLAATGIARSASPNVAERDIRTAGERLKRRLWNPLEPHISGADRVFIVPDGALHLLNFAALPVGASEYLIDRGPLIHYLTSERDVVNLAQRKRAPARGLFALGGAAFDASNVLPASASAAAAAGAPTTRSGCGSFESLQFAALPGTLAEVEDVALRWRQVQRQAPQPVNLLTGAAANERAFKTGAPGHRVLHLATHGFFLGGDCAIAPDATRAVAGLTAGPAVGSLLESPLLQTGLALAGANRRTQAAPNDEDGILTAEEVAAMDLDAVEWAVLSACDTGLGEIRAGEGVFGLRRAFQIAGARTVIMSLWSVDDEATRVWMGSLYDGRLRKSLGTAEAVREAGLTMLRDRRARGQSTHPFYWAAFIAAGDWR